MIAVPVESADAVTTSPLVGRTVTLDGALVDQATVRPVSTFPAASLSVAVSCTVLPRTTLGALGVTVIVATGAGVTVIAAVPNTDPTAARMVVDPAARPVTSPASSTVAVCVAADVQTNVMPGMFALAASRATALSCRVAPAATVLGLGVTTTLEMPTATDAVPLTPSLVAVIVTTPALRPVTLPVLDTTAIVSLVELQPTARSVNTVAPDWTVAPSCTAPPTARLVDAGATVTLVTASCLTF